MVMTAGKLKDPDRPVNVIVAEAMMLQPIGESQMRGVEVGERVTIPLSDARSVNAATYGRVLYLDEADDPSKGRHTASALDIERIELMAKNINAERERRENKAAMEAAGGGLSPAMVKQIATVVAVTMKQAGDA